MSRVSKPADRRVVQQVVFTIKKERKHYQAITCNVQQHGAVQLENKVSRVTVRNQPLGNRVRELA
jgi:hypothetical protein